MHGEICLFPARNNVLESGKAIVKDRIVWYNLAVIVGLFAYYCFVLYSISSPGRLTYKVLKAFLPILFSRLVPRSAVRRRDK